MLATSLHTAKAALSALALASVAACTQPESGAAASSASENASGGAAGVTEEFRLVPDVATVRTGSARQLEVQRCTQQIGVRLGDDAVLPELEPTCVRLTDASLLSNWSVNGTAGGSPGVGTVAAAGALGTYTAPRDIPGSNPAAVSVEVRAPGKQKVLLVSNLTVVGDCPAPVCEYIGTARAEETSGDELIVKSEATVRWTLAHWDGLEARYLPSGKVTAAWFHPGCTITISPASHEFELPRPEDDPSYLDVDFSADPVTYHGSGSSGWEGTQIWSCPPTSDEFEGVSAKWFGGEGTASGKGTVLRGSTNEQGFRGSWEFRAR